MKPTEILKDEHEAIKLMLKILEAVCKKLENGENVPTLYDGRYAYTGK